MLSLQRTSIGEEVTDFPRRRFLQLAAGAAALPAVGHEHERERPRSGCGRCALGVGSGTAIRTRWALTGVPIVGAARGDRPR